MLDLAGAIIFQVSYNKAQTNKFNISKISFSKNMARNREMRKREGVKGRRITFLEIKGTFSLLCCFSLFLFVLGQYFCINMLRWIRLQLFILKTHVNMIKEINKYHTFGSRRQTCKSQVLTIHDTRSSISFMRFGSLYFFNSFLRACYTKMMKWEEFREWSIEKILHCIIWKTTCLSAGRSFSYKKLYLFLNLQVQAYILLQVSRFSWKRCFKIKQEHKNHRH